MPNYVELTCPLTDRTQKCAPNLVQWPEQCYRFRKPSVEHTCFTLLHTSVCRIKGREKSFPPFYPADWRLEQRAFCSSRYGVANRLVVFISRKLSDREAQYSTVKRVFGGWLTLFAITPCDSHSPSVQIKFKVMLQVCGQWLSLGGVEWLFSGSSVREPGQHSRSSSSNHASPIWLGHWDLARGEVWAELDKLGKAEITAAQTL